MQARLILELDGEEAMRHSLDLEGDQADQADDAVKLVIERILAAAMSRVAVELINDRTRMPVSQAVVISALVLEADAYLNQMHDSLKLLHGVANGQISPYNTRYADLAIGVENGPDLG